MAPELAREYSRFSAFSQDARDARTATRTPNGAEGYGEVGAGSASVGMHGRARNSRVLSILSERLYLMEHRHDTGGRGLVDGGAAIRPP